MRICKVCGKIPTNHPSGKCVMCMIEGRMPPEASQREIIAEIFNIQDSKKEEGGCMAVPKDRQCKVDGCGEAAKAKGFCNKHYLRNLKEEGRIGKKSNKRGSQAVRRGPHTPESAGSNPAPAILPKEWGSGAEPESKKITPVIPVASEFCRIRQPNDKGISARTTVDILQDFYIISVDFSAYPKLHEKLLKLADEDFRNPGQQLLSMLHNTLKDAEART